MGNQNDMLRVLLADSNRQHIELIKSSLKKQYPQIKIDSVAMRATALKRLKENNYHLILSEISLKDSDGHHLIRDLKQAAPEIPVIVITGKGDSEQATQAIEWGADDYLFKNRDSLKTLPHLIEKILLKKRFTISTFAQVPITILNRMGSELDVLLVKSQMLAKNAANADVIDGFQDQITKLKKLAQKILPS